MPSNQIPRELSRALTANGRRYIQPQIESKDTNMVALLEEIKDVIFIRAAHLLDDAKNEANKSGGMPLLSGNRMNAALISDSDDKVLAASLAVIKQFNRRVKNHMPTGSSLPRHKRWRSQGYQS